MLCTTEQKTFIVEAYFRLNSIHDYNLENSLDVVNFLPKQWSTDGSTRSHGTVNDLNRKDANRQLHSGRSKSSRTPQNVDAVRGSVFCSPCKSVRRRSQVLGMNWESVRKIFITDLYLYPYRTQIKQKLTTADFDSQTSLGCEEQILGLHRRSVVSLMISVEKKIPLHTWWRLKWFRLGL